ncbi:MULTISPECIES: two-component system sensor histidine kinase LiaS [Bacillus]|uniref:Sensor histidine kinase n=2 Tax=Bacillus TaxID=1386 RepID=A0A0M4FKK6_9BACI|nr:MULTISPECIES: two-component system sensor histidine kinase LiaS [Bacillus]ALC82317.1 histidine kinase [Bacillus gobiensis]MBP1081181.1 NarL family two-component system sensor histidine kinase LiaS [Bacillus capparidis]MED1095863.1 two-component system sensor histidine kinase LiaS [Bacillus capparidis]
MTRKILSNIQWRSVRMYLGASFFVMSAITVLLFFYYQLDPSLLLSSKWFGVPFFAILLMICVFIGFGSGYIFGNDLKNRLEKLIESILKFENGNFAYRLPALGDDEIGMVADQLNEMAKRVELQVASLQKLSNERAEWQIQMKKSVVSEERQKLARDLHDVVSQQLFAISMMTSAILESTTGLNEKVAKRMKLVEGMAANAQNEMRALLMHLRPVTLEGKGLKEGLFELLQEFKEKETLEIDWELEDIQYLSKGVEDQLFRIVQEALSNVFRHSKASKVTVRLLARNSQVQLKVIDNGIGFKMDDIKTSSYGLNSIRERASEVGGVAEIISFETKGTQIDVKVPIYKERSEHVDTGTVD